MTTSWKKNYEYDEVSLWERAIPVVNCQLKNEWQHLSDDERIEASSLFPMEPNPLPRDVHRHQ